MLTPIILNWVLQIIIVNMQLFRTPPNCTTKAAGDSKYSDFSWGQKVKTVAFSLIFKLPSCSCIFSSDPTFCTSSASALPQGRVGSFLPAHTELSQALLQGSQQALLSRGCRCIHPHSGRRYRVNLRMTILVKMSGCSNILSQKT